MAWLNYNTKTIDTTDNLINVGLNFEGLIIDGQKTNVGAPDTTAGKYISGAMIINEAMGVTYQNTGSTSSPIWTIMGSGGGGSPGGVNTSVQYNDAGAFGGDTNFIWDKVPKVFQVGDASNLTNGTSFVLSDASQNIDISTNLVTFYTPAQGRILGRVNAATGTVQWGDVNPSGNSTIFYVDDPNRVIVAAAEIGGVGSHVRATATFADMKYSTGAATWGFEAGNTGGGATRITANNNVWIWPNAFGAAGTVLTDVAGNGTLSWQTPSGGTVGGTGLAGQATYWISANTIAGDTNFLWDPTIFAFSVGDLGSSANSTTLVVDDVNSQISFGNFINVAAANAVFDTSTHTANLNFNIVNIGDTNSSATDTLITLNDTTQTITNTTAGQYIVRNVIGQQSLNINTATRVSQLGDVGNANNGTLITVNDTAETINLDTDGVVSIGDVSSTGNDTKIELDDSTQTVVLTAGLGFAVRDPAGNFWYQLIPGFHQQSMGDASSAFNHTLFIVDDIARIINSNAILAGVGGHALTAAGGSKIEYVNAGTNWGFNASNSGGGAAIITANNQNYKWPDTDGNAGDTLVTDGSGVLSFDDSSVKTIKVTLSSAQILALNGTPIQLIAAPGAGKCLVVMDVTGRINFGTTAYVANTDFSVQDATTGNDLFTDGVLGTGTLLPSVATRIGKIQPTISGTIIITENGAVNVIAPTGNPTVGDGTLDLYLTYKIITL